MPNEKQNDTRTLNELTGTKPLPGPRFPPERWEPEPGDPNYTFEVKRVEMVLCLKFLAIEATKRNELKLARDALGAAEIVDEMDLGELLEQPWSGL